MQAQPLPPKSFRPGGAAAWRWSFCRHGGFDFHVRAGLSACAADSGQGGRPGGEPIFTGRDIETGQQVFLKYGLMQNGTIWGHGAYLGPDFSARYLHELSLDAGNALAASAFGRELATLDDGNARRSTPRWRSCSRKIATMPNRTPFVFRGRKSLF